MITIIQSLLQIHTRKMYFFSPFQQKWHFVLKFCTQVSRILFFSNLFEQKFQCSESQNNCLFTLNPHHAVVASFFPSVRYANQLPLMSQLSQSDIASSGLCLIPSWIYKKRPVFCTPHWFTRCMQKECISTVLWPNPIKHAPSIYPNAFKNFYRIVTHVHDLRWPQIDPFCTRPTSQTPQQWKHYKLQNEQS